MECNFIVLLMLSQQTVKEFLGNYSIFTNQNSLCRGFLAPLYDVFVYVTNVHAILDNHLCILQFGTVGIKLCFSNKPFDNSTNIIMWALSMTIAEKTPNHFVAICHVGIFIHKRPRLGTFEL